MLHSFSFSITLPLSTVYHYEPSAQGDPIVRTFEDFAAAAVPAAMPEHAILLKLFPFCKLSTTTSSLAMFAFTF